MPAAVPTSHRLRTAAVTIAVHDWGGDGPPALLAHPTGFHGRVWAPVAARLVEAGRHVWSFDFRGHGDSERSPSGYAWQGFADDVLAVTDHLGLAGAPELVGVGHSKGSAALLLAEERVPGTYASLWCYEPIVFPGEQPLPPDPDFSLATGARRRRFVWDSPDEALEAFSSKPPLDVLRPDVLRAYVEYGLRPRRDGRYELKCLPDDEAEVYSMGMAHRAFAHLADVGCPTVIACGERTEAIVPALGELIAARIPHGRLEVVPGLGHFGPMEDPDAVVASILRFAARRAR